MNKKIKELYKSTAVRIVMVLLLANLFLFLAVRTYISDDTAEIKTDKIENTQIVKTGWHVVHWSYSLLKYFKPGGPEA